MQAHVVRERPLPPKSTATLPRSTADDKYASTITAAPIRGQSEQPFRENEYASMRLLPPIPDGMAYNGQNMFNHNNTVPASHFRQMKGSISPEHVYESPDSIRRIQDTVCVNPNSGMDNMPRGPDSPPHYFDLDPRACNMACTGRCSGASGYCTCAQEVVPFPIKVGSHTGNKRGNEKGTYSI